MKTIHNADDVSTVAWQNEVPYACDAVVCEDGWAGLRVADAHESLQRMWATIERLRALVDGDDNG